MSPYLMYIDTKSWQNIYIYTPLSTFPYNQYCLLACILLACLYVCLLFMMPPPWVFACMHHPTHKAKLQCLSTVSQLLYSVTGWWWWWCQYYYSMADNMCASLFTQRCGCRLDLVVISKWAAALGRMILMLLDIVYIYFHYINCLYCLSLCIFILYIT